jgi:hypothetical protein
LGLEGTPSWKVTVPVQEDRTPKASIHGAAPLGSLFAARLQEGGNHAIIYCLTGTQQENAYVPFGELDGRITAQTLQMSCSAGEAVLRG